MAASRRIIKELSVIQNADLPYFCNVEVDGVNFRIWRGLIIPSNQPYNKGAFMVEFAFPPEYPFKAPKVIFKTKIYHPNIGEDGQVCLPLLEDWKPSTTVYQVVEALVVLVNSPEPGHPLRPELAQEFLQNKEKFFKVAEQYTVNNAARRPYI